MTHSGCITLPSPPKPKEAQLAAVEGAERALATEAALQVSEATWRATGDARGSVPAHTTCIG